MAAGGRSLSLQSASWPALALQLAAALLGLLATVCWFWASISPVQLETIRGAEHDLRWWSASVAVLGIGAVVLIWFAATVRGPVGLLVLAVLLLALGVASVAFLRLVVPTANPIHPLGLAVPYAVAGFAAAGTGCLLAAGSIAVAAQPGSRVARWTLRPWTGVVAGSSAAVLIVGAGLVIVDRSRDYLLGANEYRTVGDVDREPAEAPVTALAGGDHWVINVPGLTLMRPAPTDFGIGLASGQDVIMIDRATGGVRWRYTRSDEHGPVSVASTGEGRQVLATWSSGAVYVLDARTGERVGHWSTAGTGSHILDPALPVVARTGPDDRTTIARVRADGRDVWTYALERCQGARATLSGTVVIVTAVPHCAGASERLVALDAATGSRLWVANLAGDVRAVVPATAFVVEPPGGGAATGSLSALSLVDGGLRWSTALPRHARGMPCVDHQVQASAQVALVICTWDLTDYPMGLEQYASTIYTYDAVSGRPRGSVTYGPAPVVSSALLANGSVVVARADLSEGWTLDVVSASSRRATLRVGSYSGGHLATVRGLTVFDDQIFVVDSGAESLRSPR
ncbi:hypothetical protein GCM10022204_34970 [Microlunatus aurantiacus]|uniref:Pyrrolo-quinoline quinone repeat domain-containing protein n=1 Tax=Microlunatus aurantiacus TaxID=446786 RepID=A0ABP7E3J8_9ACTN